MGQRSAAVRTFGSAQHAATHCSAVVMAAELMTCIPEHEAEQVWPLKEVITHACFATPPAPVAGNTETLFEAAVATKAARATSFIMIMAPERGARVCRQRRRQQTIDEPIVNVTLSPRAESQGNRVDYSTAPVCASLHASVRPLAPSRMMTLSLLLVPLLLQSATSPELFAWDSGVGSNAAVLDALPGLTTLATFGCQSLLSCAEQHPSRGRLAMAWAAAMPPATLPCRPFRPFTEHPQRWPFHRPGPPAAGFVAAAHARGVKVVRATGVNCSRIATAAGRAGV